MSALADYYAAQANEFNAHVPLLSQQTRLIGEQADQVAPDSAARRLQQGADAGLESAQAGLESAQAGSITQKTPAEIAQDNARTQGIMTQNAFLAPQATQDILSKSLNNQLTASSIQGPDFSNPLIQAVVRKMIGNNARGLEKGGIVAKDGKLPPAGKTDTVPALLAPGEAVLNKHAVDHYGSDVIEHMNRMGLLRGAAHEELKALTKSMKGTKDKAKSKKKVA